MGRKRRNTAKTGDVALYKSRDNTEKVAKKADDNDNTYDEVDRYHNARNELKNDMLKFNQSDDDDSDGGLEDNRENVFDLGVASSGSESEDSDSDSEDEAPQRERREQEISDGSETDNSSVGNEMDQDGEETDLLNWGTRKKDYYHGDTADLEIGQEVEDAELEEEAGREVLKARMEHMSEDDFKIDDYDDSANKADEIESKETSISANINSTKRKRIHELSKKDKIKYLKKSHPELMPLLTHFREDAIRPCAEETLVVTDTVFKDKDNAEAIGSTKGGLQYLLTKTMLQTSTALNVCQYLLLKAEMTASTVNEDDDFGFDQQEDQITNHPVITRLDQLNKLSEKLHEGVEEKVTGLKDQMKSLVKASALLGGEDIAGDADSDDSENDNEDIQMESGQESIPESASESDSSSDEEDASEVQRKVMTEARFSLRPEDDKDDLAMEGESSRKAKRRLRRRALVPSFEDYGDDDQAADERDVTAAGQSLASTLNTLTQRGKSRTKSSISRPEVVDGDDEDRFKRGLEMMSEEFGGGSDMDKGGDEEDISDGELNDDLGDDDFYSQIKNKSKAKKEYKKSLYAVAPKYPGMDGEVEGERAVGNMIMNNRGLVPHRKKEFRNPRLKRREQYRKAIIRRKGAVRDVRTDEGHKYGGEETGIKSNLSRSRKLGAN